MGFLPIPPIPVAAGILTVGAMPKAKDECWGFFDESGDRQKPYRMLRFPTTSRGELGDLFRDNAGDATAWLVFS